MSRSLIVRHKAAQLKGSAQVRARRYFAWFTLFPTGSELLLFCEQRLISESVLERAWLCRSSQQAICMTDRLLGQLEMAFGSALQWVRDASAQNFVRI
jgi:hypothetical protein